MVASVAEIEALILQRDEEPAEGEDEGGRLCRECGQMFPVKQVKLYDVIRKDGDYPNTLLCRECVDEYRQDPDIRLRRVRT